MAKKTKKKAKKRAKAAKAATKRKPAKKAAAKRTAAKKKKKAKSTKRPAKRAAKPAKRAVPAKRKTKDVIGEGNYTASRNFRKKEEAFIAANRTNIPKLGKQAEAALEGPEGDELRRAEEESGERGQE